jgi:hypothetical protein
MELPYQSAFLIERERVSMLQKSEVICTVISVISITRITRTWMLCPLINLQVFGYTHTPSYVVAKGLINLRGIDAGICYVPLTSMPLYLYKSTVRKLIVYGSTNLSCILLLQMYSTHSYAHNALMLI